MKKVLALLIVLIIVVTAIPMSMAAPTVESVAHSMGDADGDGIANSKDLLIVKKHVLSISALSGVALSASDLDTSGIVNSADLLLLKRHVLGRIEFDKKIDADVFTKLAVPKKTVGDKMVSPISGDTYTLKFIDDFNGTQLNMDNWNYYTRNYNQAEEQVNRKENVLVQDGKLLIKGLKEDTTYTGDAASWETPKTSNLTGGAINSYARKSFKYGRMEILARLPYSLGMWPAFWTMGTGRGWPWGGEIDIMELVGGVDQWGNYRDDEYITGLHYCRPEATAPAAYGAEHKSVGIGKFEIPNGPSQGKKLNDNWRIIGMEWTNQSISMYCDGKKIGEKSITDPNMREAFHLDHYLILNLVMGGSWAGTPNDKTVFPQVFEVDWVKVWQK